MNSSLHKKLTYCVQICWCNIFYSMYSVNWLLRNPFLVPLCSPLFLRLPQLWLSQLHFISLVIMCSIPHLCSPLFLKLHQLWLSQLHFISLVIICSFPHICSPLFLKLPQLWLSQLHLISLVIMCSFPRLCSTLFLSLPQLWLPQLQLISFVITCSFLALITRILQALQRPAVSITISIYSHQHVCSGLQLNNICVAFPRWQGITVLARKSIQVIACSVCTVLGCFYYIFYSEI